MTVYSRWLALPVPLATTWPPATPMCTATGRPASAASAGMASRMASAARTARSASLPWATGAPNTRHDAVADVLVDLAAMLLDEAVGAVEEAAEQGVHLLGVELPAQRRVAGEVGEEHRHLPPLALKLRAWPPPPAPCAPQRGDGVEQLAPMADRDHAEVLQVLGREPGQDLGVDGVVAERLLVLPQPELAQPSRDVHLRFLRGMPYRGRIYPRWGDVDMVERRHAGQPHRQLGPAGMNLPSQGPGCRRPAIETGPSENSFPTR